MKHEIQRAAWINQCPPNNAAAAHATGALPLSTARKDRNLYRTPILPLHGKRFVSQVNISCLSALPEERRPPKENAEAVEKDRQYPFSHSNDNDKDKQPKNVFALVAPFQKIAAQSCRAVIADIPDFFYELKMTSKGHPSAVVPDIA